MPKGKATVKGVLYSVRVLQLEDVEGIKEGTLVGFKWKRRKYEGRTSSCTLVRKQAHWEDSGDTTGDLVGVFKVVPGTGMPARKKEMLWILERRRMKPGGAGIEEVVEELAKLRIQVGEYLYKGDILQGNPHRTTLKYATGSIKFTVTMEFKFQIPQNAMHLFPMKSNAEVSHLLKKLSSENPVNIASNTTTNTTPTVAPQSAETQVSTTTSDSSGIGGEIKRRNPYGQIKKVEELKSMEEPEITKKKRPSPYGTPVMVHKQEYEASDKMSRDEDKSSPTNAVRDSFPPEARGRYGRIPPFDPEKAKQSKSESNTNKKEEEPTPKSSDRPKRSPYGVPIVFPKSIPDQGGANEEDDA